jgi:hypothetical protein
MKLEREQATPSGSKGSQVDYSHFGNFTVYQVQAKCEPTMKLEQSNLARIDGEISACVESFSRRVSEGVG